MLFNQNSRVSRRPVTITSFLVFTALAGCAKADNPELFRADPNFLEDGTLDLPSTGSTGTFNYEIIQGIAVLEGDMLLGRVDQDGTLQKKIMHRGLGRSDTFGRWPDGVVPYAIPANSTNIQQDRIAEAIAHWTEKSSITFIEHDNSNQDQYPNYVRFESSNSCASYVGMQGGEQPILVSDACSVGSIIHEVGHALGLFHEHTRPDRNNFAQINWNKIVSGKEINFEILDAGVQNYGPYDYGSIMHYGEYFFSATGEPTIIVPDGVAIGQRQSLSSLDIDSVNNMYATDLALFQPTLDEVEAGKEVGISIANQGQLGAQQLQLVAKVSTAAQWQGISPDSGWECMMVDVELRCDRQTLAEQTTSNFTLLLSSPSVNSEDISLTLTSRTLDTDLSTNSFNVYVLEAEPRDPQAATPTEAPSPDPTGPITVVPNMGTPEVVEPTTEKVPEKIGAALPASAGADNGILAVVSGLALLWQRRRRMTTIKTTDKH
jgi:astacin